MATVADSSLDIIIETNVWRPRVRMQNTMKRSMSGLDWNEEIGFSFQYAYSYDIPKGGSSSPQLAIASHPRNFRPSLPSHSSSLSSPSPLPKRSLKSEEPITCRQNFMKKDYHLFHHAKACNEYGWNSNMRNKCLIVSGNKSGFQHNLAPRICTNTRFFWVRCFW